jgi:hypothetical protein
VSTRAEDSALVACQGKLAASHGAKEHDRL